MRVKLSSNQVDDIKKWLKLVRKISPTNLKLSHAQDLIFSKGFGYRDFKEANKLSHGHVCSSGLNPEEKSQVISCLQDQFHLSEADSIEVLNKLKLDNPDTRRVPMFIDEAGLFFNSIVDNQPISDGFLQKLRNKGIFPLYWETVKVDGEYLVLTMDSYAKAQLDIDFESNTEEIKALVCTYALPIMEAIQSPEVFKHNPLDLQITSDGKLLNSNSKVVIAPNVDSKQELLAQVQSLLTGFKLNVQLLGKYSMRHLDTSISIDIGHQFQPLVSPTLYFNICSEYPLLIKGCHIEDIPTEDEYPSAECISQFQKLRGLQSAIKDSGFEEQLKSRVNNATDSDWMIIWEHLQSISHQGHLAEKDQCRTPLLFSKFSEELVLSWAGSYFSDFEFECSVDDHCLIEYLLMPDVEGDGSFDEYEKLATLAAALTYQDIGKGRQFARALDRLMIRFGAEFSQIKSLLGAFDWFQKKLSSETVVFGDEYRSVLDTFRLGRKHNFKSIQVTQSIT
ncbi:hypothetical protein VIBNIFTn2_120070 [Vibrio nigripulchritudo FTn2]|uniref:hypothetical protein n=1 Tax=Vibrio nigripulchritudo TaxID=28173 RepID=UPI0003B19B7D|nr:hypothetical protein [Vibrio nigripulchritudo]CCN40088.1 hypothetical protein VIBNIFTn2_120070 [Vibrio nigripulchritudo FTn2]